jgi:hypothetical protein
LEGASFAPSFLNTGEVMRKILLALLLSYTAFLMSCKTIQGTSINPEQNYGKLWVTCSVDSASIFLNNEDTGKRTPALIENIPAGETVVRVLICGYQPIPDSFEVEIKVDKIDTAHFEMQLIESLGDLQITTTPDSALIILDNLPRGYSPLTIDCIPTGAHTVKLMKGSYHPEEVVVEVFQDSLTQLTASLTLTRSVLIEHFSNTDCIPCVEADEIIEQVLTESGVVKTVSLGYHANFPGPSDPMYLAAVAGNDARMEYYDVSFAPTIWVDGVEGFGFDIENKLRSALNERSQIQPGAILEIFDFEISRDSVISGRVRIQALENLNNVVLHIALIEKEINITPPPGINGQTYFFDVFRGFYPSPDGTAITLAQGEKRFVSFNVSMNQKWVSEEIQVVAFLQKQNKEIVQAAWTLYP